jgi:hypothetical protein
VTLQRQRRILFRLGSVPKSCYLLIVAGRKINSFSVSFPARLYGFSMYFSSCSWCAVHQKVCLVIVGSEAEPGAGLLNAPHYDDHRGCGAGW